MTSTTRHLVLQDTPVGPLLLLAEGDALVGLYMDEHHHAPQITDPNSDSAHVDDPFLSAVAGQLREYFAGDRSEFDIALAPVGTAFQHKVWGALREIPFGTTCSYGEVAARIGQPTASRAVGLANGRNPISIIVPCHRVVGAGGNLTGYGGGLPNKKALLALEQARNTAALF